MGHIHLRVEEKFTVDPVAAIVLTGYRMPHHYETNDQEVDFYEIKGHVENLLSSLGVGEARFTPSHVYSLHPGRQAQVILNSITIGVIGEVHPRHLTELGISQRVYFAQINLYPLMSVSKSEKKVKAFSMTPASERDWTISVEDKTPIGTLLEEIRSFDSPILEEGILLDLYQSEKIGKDKKNATFRLRYRDQNKTIKAKEIEMEHRRLTQHIAEKLGNRVP